MIKAGVLGLAALAGAWTPLNAQTFNLSINGTVTGVQSTVMCGIGSAPACFASYPGGVMTEDFLKVFDLPLYTADLPEGDSLFSFGSPYSIGLYSGTINNSAGVLTGRDLSFSFQSGSCRTGTVGCQYVFANAPTFNVVGGIPEPATWLSMLLGFLALGTAMRKLRALKVRGQARPLESTAEAS